MQVFVLSFYIITTLFDILGRARSISRSSNLIRTRYSMKSFSFSCSRLMLRPDDDDFGDEFDQRLSNKSEGQIDRSSENETGNMFHCHSNLSYNCFYILNSSTKASFVYRIKKTSGSKSSSVRRNICCWHRSWFVRYQCFLHSDAINCKQ